MAYKTFANGFPLPASDLNNYLMNQSVIVFADSTARTAALPTPTEGMVTYLEDSNSLYLWTGAAWVAQGSPITTEGDLIVGGTGGVAERLAVGTDDQVLTLASGVPTWADAAGGGAGLTLLSSTTLSGTTVNVTSISQDYTKLVAYLYGATTGGSVIEPRFNIKTGANLIGVDMAGVWNIQGSLSLRGFYGTTTIGTTDRTMNSSNAAILEIFNYAISSNRQKTLSYYGMTGTGSTGSRITFNMLGRTDSSTTGGIDGISVSDGQGGSFTGGTLEIWGS